MNRLRRLLAFSLVASFVAALTRRSRAASARRRRVRAQQGIRRYQPELPGSLRLSVVLPAFDEADRIAATVGAVRSELEPDLGVDVEVVVVDDGSSDGTGAAAAQAGAVVVRHERNRGKGAAVRSGVLAARGRTIVFTDADLAYAPDHLAEVLTEVEAGWDLVIGSRRHAETEALVRARPLRSLGGRVVNLATRLVLARPYGDTQCGLKGFNAPAGRAIFEHCRVDGFAFDVEVLHLAERYRCSLREIPVRVVNSRRSSVHVARDGLQLLRDLLRIRRYARLGAYDLTSAEEASLVP